MNIYKTRPISEYISGNSYVGRGIVIGKSADASSAVFAYFIMGRSENSRNRVFERNGDGIIIKPYDASKVLDPSLIIYSPVRRLGKNYIVTNGNQTDTVYDFLKDGKTFEEALETRCFEPDSPNFTPRISALISVREPISYKLSILKSADETGSACNRFTYSYKALDGVGHFIHTYVCDGTPIPSFQGEPERTAIPSDIDEFTDSVWNNLDKDNRISLYTGYISLKDGKLTDRLINKNK